jgi:hypothetical protein
VLSYPRIAPFDGIHACVLSCSLLCDRLGWLAVSTRFSTPVLVMEDGSKLHDSRDIMRYADGRVNHALFPSEEVSKYVEHFHDFLGPVSRDVSWSLLWLSRWLATP